LGIDTHRTIRLTTLPLAGALIAFIAGASAWAQRNVRFHAIDLEAAGLAQSTIPAIVQDRTGFLWVGTRDGLSRFDGHRFKTFRHDSLDRHSLSGNFVISLFVDRDGALWVGTYAHGLNRFDAATQQFTRFLHDPDDPTSLAGIGVMCIAQDRAGFLWVGTGGGLNRMNVETEAFQRFRHNPDDPSSLPQDAVRCLFEDSAGRLWLGLWGGGLARFDRDAGAFISYRHDGGDAGSLANDIVTALAEDETGDLWVATWGGGLDRFNPETGRFSHYSFNPVDPERGPNSNLLSNMIRDRSGLLWIGTFDGGLNRFDPRGGRFAHFPAKVGDPAALAGNWVRSLWQDRAGELWIGLDSGLHKLSPGKGFVHYRHEPGNPASLSHNRVRAIHEDATGALWVGTNQGLNRMARDKGDFRRFFHDPQDPDSLSHDRILTIFSREETLWIGTGGGGLNRFDLRSERFRHYRHDPADPASIASDIVYPVLIDREGVVWIGTDFNGLDAFDPRTGEFRHYRHNPRDSHSLSHDTIYGAYEDSAGSLWIGSAKGLNRLDRASGRFDHFFHDPDRSDSLSHDTVFCFFERRPGELWVGSDGGLDLMDLDGRFLAHYDRRDGFPNETIHGILGDARGRLWMSSNGGLIRFDPDTLEVKGYDVHDGLQANEFLRRAFSRGADGAMYFGGVNGFNAFYPDQITSDPIPPPVALTEFLLFNRPANLRRNDPDSPLQFPIGKTRELTLTHEDQVFAFEFAALSYVSPEKNRYAYRLEPFDKAWIETSADNRQATYTNIPPGRYRFRVKAANGDGVWNEQGASLAIRVLPPWWRSLPAYAFYFALLAGLVLTYMFAQRRKLERERAVNDRLRQVDSLKDQLLTDVSHELRTPLNGIVGLAESLAQDPWLAEREPVAEDLGMIALSGKRLGHMVNNLIDYARLRKEILPCRRSPVSIREAAQKALALCRPLAQEKGLALVNACPADLPPVLANERMLRQALYNLVDNAVKFTERGGVRVEARVGSGRLEGAVIDTGPGIPEERLGHIFQPFEQGDGSIIREHPGAGLGLTVAHDLIALMGGELTARAHASRGAELHFHLPLAASPLTAANGEAPGDARGPHVLIVDDDRVNRRVVRRFLEKADFRLSEAADGEAALRLLRNQRDIDLVLLDIMMPRMSGYEFCRAVRGESSLGRLPVLFLTAKDSSESKEMARAAGGDDFLTKPVSREQLLTRVQALLARRGNDPASAPDANV